MRVPDLIDIDLRVIRVFTHSEVVILNTAGGVLKQIGPSPTFDLKTTSRDSRNRVKGVSPAAEREFHMSVNAYEKIRRYDDLTDQTSNKTVAKLILFGSAFRFLDSRSRLSLA